MSTPSAGTTMGTTTGTRSPQQAANSLFNDVKTTSNAIEQGDWLSAGMGATKVAMDVISISGDPLGAISSAGFGWLIGHIKFLREPFDKLLGDANAITGSAQGWTRASTQLANSANAYRQATQQETRSWTGPAADAYRAAGESQARNLDSLAEVSKAVSQALEGAGKMLAEVRKAVMDIISQACNKIIMIIIEALAAAWGSFGASIAKGIAQSVQTAATSAAKSMQKIQKLVSSLQKIMQLVQNIMRLVQAVKQLLQTIGGKASGDTSAMQVSGSTLGYGGTISDGTAPRGTSDVVNLQSLDPGRNYTYAAYTPGTPGAVNLTPLDPGQSYRYDGYQPGVQLAQANTGGGAAQQVSQNGWPVDPPRAARTVPGTTVRVVVANGPAGDVLMHVLTQVDQRVERLDPNATWGYAHREIRGGGELSNHASATAVDVNAPQHALGARGTFSQAQVDEIHRILNDDVNGVVRWGGDYRGRRDEMHFEIIGNEEQVRAAAERVRLINLTP
ncbi:MAG: M15 family metallopeptidase [Labedaea sp.]